jgi:ribonucleoside-diphosphate reductase alpha chain
LSIDGPIHGKTNGKTRSVPAKAKAPKAARAGIVARRYSTVGVDPLDTVEYERRDCVIKNPDGSVVFETRGAEIPKGWSQLASDIAISKYFRRAGLFGDPTKGETSARQLVHRIAHSIREAGELRGYFVDADEATTFEAELSWMLIHQYGAFNSPVWFNCGLFQRYNIAGQGGNWAWDESRGAVAETANAYERPQCSACFIQSVQDDLMGIFELVRNEARLFKYGSGTGSNFSSLRGRQEKLSGGGTSSGLMSFLEVFDRAAGSTKSGGTTRRAAKMVCLDMDHPEILDFIRWKMREEKKAQALIAAGYPSDFNGEAYHTVSGQNSNNSVRVTDEFMRAVETDSSWSTRARTNGRVVDTYRAKDVWREVAESAWACADPGLQYDTTINDWHTCSVTGRINASNPCSEYMFLDDTACNLSSLNLTKFLRDNPNGTLDFDVEGYRHAARVFFLAQEILVDFSSYPTQQIAQNSHDYRPLGLGYANLGTLLMLMGLAYDSDEGRSLAGALTAILTGQAYRVSAEVAAHKGPFAGYAKNQQPMLRVMRKHRDAAYRLDDSRCPKDVLSAAREDWDEAVRLGEQFGYRNAQATVLAPTGTIGLLMDCDTTGIEPDFALVKWKKLAGGGYFKIVNASVERALKRQGYSAAQITEILAWVVGTNAFLNAPVVSREYLKGKGFANEDITRVEDALPGSFTLDMAFAPHVLGPDLLKRLGVEEAAKTPGFSLLRHWGLSDAQVDTLNDHVLGRMTVEGAPHLRDEHLSVFDCANRCGKYGTRYIAPMAHVKMMAAAQPFLSGAISKTVNLPNDATVEEIAEIYHQGWKLGLKAVALYRDGCKASQPLSTTSDKKKDDKAEAKAEEPVVEVVKVEPAPVARVEARMVAASPSAAVATGSEAGAEFGPLFSKAPALGPQRAFRYRLPKKRRGFTQEARIGGHKVFLRTGEYEDGQLGEIFIDMHKEGAAFRSMMNAFAIAVSMGLQHGVPLAEFVDQFTFTRFEPQGAVSGHANVKFATSIIDYVFRVLGIEYQRRYDLAHVPPEEAAATTTDAPVNNTPAMSQAPAGALFATTTGGDSEGGSALDKHLGKMMGDAPFCDNCGHITVRNGACYRCLNCGSSMGCS